MSETQTSATLRKPAVPVEETITDSLGRSLTVRKTDALSELDLIEAAGGQNASNERWMLMATFAACVIQLDGVPRIPLANRDKIRQHMQRVGTEGLAAVIAWLQRDDVPEQTPVADETAAVAKN